MAGLPPFVQREHLPNLKPADMSDDIAFADGSHVLQWIFGVFTSGDQPVSPVTGRYIVKLKIDHLSDEQRAAFLNWFMEGDMDEKLMWLGRQLYMHTGVRKDVPVDDMNPINFDDIPSFFNWLFQAEGYTSGKPPAFTLADGTFKVTGGRRRRSTRKRKTTYG